MSHYRATLEAIAYRAATGAVIDQATRDHEAQEKMINEGREGLKRLVDEALRTGDLETRGMVRCGYALGVKLEIDFSKRPKPKRKRVKP